MNSVRTTRIIGSSFGLVFVQANAGALPTAVAIPLRVLAVVAFLFLGLFNRRPAAPEATTAPRARFGGRYWLVVAAEVLAIATGLMVINKVLHTPHATVGWIAFVVGVHFFGLASAWRRPELRVLGGSMAACGAVGMVLAALGAPDAAISTVAGIAPGALLFGSVWWSSRTQSGANSRPAAVR
ncbi:hypothetical protein F7Q99_15645 [Streptomyces kaniharaensis]|uniref:Uncharacterized protein n=1 Tax=Streptomyces kaniharaensis TaxID=212423 RepID=A0A6N7KQ51_9ACTN|nr:hypothetical protein [Streptomyces kaniharaensis]MQS13666.1 hypothetical protein [Streptomyces kaniharaensis]